MKTLVLVLTASAGLWVAYLTYIFTGQHRFELHQVRGNHSLSVLRFDTRTGHIDIVGADAAAEQISWHRLDRAEK